MQVGSSYSPLVFGLLMLHLPFYCGPDWLHPGLLLNSWGYSGGWEKQVPGSWAVMGSGLGRAWLSGQCQILFFLIW